MSLDEKLIVTVAPTGSGSQWKKTPYLPIAPSDIAAQAVETYKAGAAVAHIHVRDLETKAEDSGANGEKLAPDATERPVLNASQFGRSY